MKKNSASRSAFFNPHVLISLAFCAISAVLALLTFALYPGGNAFARQRQSSGQELPQQNVTVLKGARTQEQELLRAQAAAITDSDLDVPGQGPLSALLSSSPNVPDATFVVNTTTDTQDVTPGDGLCADSVGACSLRAAITEANALANADIITLPAGTYTMTLVATNEDSNAGGDYDIRSPLTINGACSGTTIIQANAAPNTATERVIQITTGSTTVNINDVTIRNGNLTSISAAGGGVRVDIASATVNLTNVIITANRVIVPFANNFGGGISVSGVGANVTLTGCTVSNNSAIASGSDIGFAGGVYNQQAIVNLNNSTVTGNTASSLHGGIRTLSSINGAATTNITNSTISNNTAQGINAPARGGGVANIAGSTFAATTTITSSTINGNVALGASGAGGGIENIANSTGAAVVNLSNSTVSGNSADRAGGIHNDSSGTVSLDYSTVAANTASTQGGGLYPEFGGITIKDSIVGDNTAPTGPDISGGIASGGFNHVEITAGGTFTPVAGDVTGSDAQLSVLQNNGGLTNTHMPSGTSPVLNTIANGTNGCGTTVSVDQRGYPRPSGGACEKGSVERQPADASVCAGDDTWTAISTTSAPTGRQQHTAVWTGSQMIVWGGFNGSALNTGARYTPGTDSWVTISTIDAPTARYIHTAVWTGSEMIVWGGGDAGLFNTGGRYNPATDSWIPTSTTNAPNARIAHTAVWTGSEMIVWGGYPCCFNTGGKYNPTTDSWTPTNITGAAESRGYHTAVWTGSEMIVWGGIASGNTRLSTGGKYDPTANSWTLTSTTNVPVARADHTAVWTGSEMIVWGGYTGSGLNTGGKYNPGTNSWTATSTINAPGARWYHSAVWIGNEMIVWSGYNGSSGLNTGGRYNPGGDSWTATSTINAPTVRYRHTGVGTGSDMIVWGGHNGTSYQTLGGKYCTQPTASISGTIVYCSNPSLNPVPGVTLTLIGDAGGSTLSDGSGNYTLSSVPPGGNYTVTPTKAALAPGTAGISTVDVIAVQRHFLNLGTPLSGCQLTAADVDLNTSVNTVDVIAVQRFFLGLSTGIANVGKYQFNPVSRSYCSLTSNQTGQNYNALVFGDVASGFVH